MAVFVAKQTYTALFAWWADSWFQRRESKRLLDEVEVDLAFLVSKDAAKAEVVGGDWASVQVSWQNLLLTLLRVRGDLTVSVAPRFAPLEIHQLGRVIAAMENRHLSERDEINDLTDVAKLLRPHLQDLNTALSPDGWARLKERL